MTDTESESAYTAEVVDTPTTQSDVKIELEGENRDTFILVPGLLGYDTLSLHLFGNEWVLSDYWSGSREMFEDYIVVRPSAFGVSLLSSSSEKSRERYTYMRTQIRVKRMLCLLFEL